MAPPVLRTHAAEALPIGFGKTVLETSAYAACAARADGEGRRSGSTATTEAVLRGSQAGAAIGQTGGHAGSSYARVRALTTATPSTSKIAGCVGLAGDGAHSKPVGLAF